MTNSDTGQLFEICWEHELVAVISQHQPPEMLNLK